MCFGITDYEAEQMTSQPPAKQIPLDSYFVDFSGTIPPVVKPYEPGYGILP